MTETTSSQSAGTQCAHYEHIPDLFHALARRTPWLRWHDAQDAAQAALECWVRLGMPELSTAAARRLVHAAAVDEVRKRAREAALLSAHPGILHRREDRQLNGIADELATLLASTRRNGGQRTKDIVRLEVRIIGLAMAGRTNRQIADALDLTEHQVRVYRQRIRHRLKKALDASAHVEYN